MFLAGRTSLEGVAEDIRTAGGSADVSVVDALDPDAVEAHLDALVASTGKIDISINATSLRGDLHGIPLRQMIVDDFTSPALTVLRSHFCTSTAAARGIDRGRIRSDRGDAVSVVRRRRHRGQHSSLGKRCAAGARGSQAAPDQPRRARRRCPPRVSSTARASSESEGSQKRAGAGTRTRNRPITRRVQSASSGPYQRLRLRRRPLRVTDTPRVDSISRHE